MYADVTVLLLGKPRPEKLDSVVALIMVIQYCHSKDLVNTKIAAHNWGKKREHQRLPERKKSLTKNDL